MSIKTDPPGKHDSEIGMEMKKRTCTLVCLSLSSFATRRAMLQPYLLQVCRCLLTVRFMSLTRHTPFESFMAEKRDEDKHVDSSTPSSISGGKPHPRVQGQRRIRTPGKVVPIRTSILALAPFRLHCVGTSMCLEFPSAPSFFPDNSIPIFIFHSALSLALHPLIPRLCLLGARRWQQ